MTTEQIIATEKSILAGETVTDNTIITSEQLLQHWQGHRRPRKLIEAFPADKFATYSIGGMRPFSELALELLIMGAPGVRGILTGQWQSFGEMEHHLEGANLHNKEEILRRWDEATAEIDILWAQIPPQRFKETTRVFNAYEGTVYWALLYFIDNEIHHRGQAFVYLRSLGIEPPAFWDRA
jgi:uncharacterized damage-inducible protein DinB